MSGLSSALIADSQRPGTVRKFWPVSSGKEENFNIKFSHRQTVDIELTRAQYRHCARSWVPDRQEHFGYTMEVARGNTTIYRCHSSASDLRLYSQHDWSTCLAVICAARWRACG